MNKHIVWGLLVAVVFGVASVSPLFIKNAEATTVLLSNALKPVSVLGVGVLSSGAAKFTIMDMDDEAQENMTMSLPPVSGNNGMIYIIKRATADNPYSIILSPESGDTIENGAFSEVLLDADGEYYEFIGDTTNDTWWIINHGAPEF